MGLGLDLWYQSDSRSHLSVKFSHMEVDLKGPVIEPQYRPQNNP